MNIKNIYSSATSASLAITILIAVAAVTVNAEILVYEPFDYQVGTRLDTHGGGLGMSGNWLDIGGVYDGYAYIYDESSAATPVSNDGGPLSWDGVVVNLPTSPAGGSRYVSNGISDGDKFASYRYLAQNASAMAGPDGVLWASVVWHQAGNSYGAHIGLALGTDAFADRSRKIDTSGSYGAGLGNAIGVGGAISTRAVTPVVFDNGAIAVRTTAGAANVSNSLDNIIVLKFEFGASDTVTAYTFTEDTELKEATFNANAVSATYAIDETTLNILTFSQVRGINAVDEIRIGDTFDDVIGGDSADTRAEKFAAVLNELRDHITGTITLDPNEIAAYKIEIDNSRTIFGTHQIVIEAAMDLVQTYDTVEGPLWVDGVKRWTDWDRRLATDDNIHWVIYHVMQYIMDYTYTEENLASYESLLGNFEFGSAEHFPNNYMTLTPPADPEAVYTVTINGSFPKTFGHHTMHWENMPARKCTGAYVLPGSVATVTVPPSLVNAGYQIRVGAHALDLTNKPFYLRLGRSSLAYDITSEETKVTNPLGGGIYIEVPYLADAGVVDIQIKNTIRAPYYSYNTVTGHITTLSQWQNTERNHQAPWADFQTEKFMVQVPTSWIYAFEDPVTSMADWDKAMDACNDLMGFDHDRGKESSYDQIDVLIDAGALSPGYPTCNNTYNPWGTYNGNANHYLVRGPQYAPSYHFHELGHGYLFRKFPGETESNVNLLHVPVWNRKFGYDLDTAFYKSSPAHPGQAVTLDDTAVYWMTCSSFVNDVPMTKSEKQYQLRGHAKFVEIARQFGWDVLGDYWRSFNEDYENGISLPNDTDSLLLRLSESVGYDIRPLFHFWGVHPVNSSSLQADIEAENIRPSNKIYDLLERCKSLVPADNDSFRQFCLHWYGVKPNPTSEGTEGEHGQQWDTYDAGSTEAIVGQIDYILALYFPNGRPGLDIGPDKITWSQEPVQMNPLFKGGFAPTSFTWTAEPADAVVFTPNESAQSPTVTITKSSGDPISVAVTLIADDGVIQEQDAMIIDVYDDSCKAAIGKGLPAIYPGDVDENCIIDIRDFAVLAAEWLYNGLLAEPIKSP